MTEESEWKKLWRAFPGKPKISPWDRFSFMLGQAIGTAEMRLLYRIKDSMFPPIPKHPEPPPSTFENADFLLTKARQLYPAYQAEFFDDKNLGERLYWTYQNHCAKLDIEPLPPTMLATFAGILIDNFPVAPFDLSETNLAAVKSQTVEGARARDAIRQFIIYATAPSETSGHVLGALNQILCELTLLVPRIHGPSPFTTTLSHRIDVSRIAEIISLALHRSTIVNTPYFRDERAVLARNHEAKPKNPADLLAHTWLPELLDIPLPFPLTAFLKHHWAIVARTGHGKTQLLQTLIVEHLKEPDPPAIIVIDSQGQMLQKLERLACFTTTLKDRLVVVDPQASPALNMFDVPRLSEEAEIEVIALYNYIFSAIDAELTSRQGTAFSYVVRLMLSIPGATIMTLLELMEENVPLGAHKQPNGRRSKFWPYIEKLDPVAQSYFENRFFTATTRQTKEQLATRLYGILRVRAFQRMFSAPENRLDLFDAMEKRKIVLINTGGLGEASSLFGRYMIARALQAAFQRDIFTNPDPAPALLFVDEAFDLLDANVNRILIQARKFGLFIRFATQHYDQIQHDVRAATAANTEVKLAGGLSAADARALAAEFRTEAETMLGTRLHPGRGSEFMCHIQNVTSAPIKIFAPFGLLECEDRADERAFSARAQQLRGHLAGAQKSAPIASPVQREVNITRAPDDPPPAPTPDEPAQPTPGRW